MTLDEYRDYEKRFAEGAQWFTHISSGSWLKVCRECPEDADFEYGVCYEAEPYFSYYRCSICDTTLGGNRTDGHARNVGDEDGPVAHLRLCDDCVYYNEYGRLDDMTMIELGLA